MRRAQEQPGHTATVDLVNQTVTDDDGFAAGFTLDAFIRERLLGGLDDIGMTLRLDDAISSFEERRPRWLVRT
jgi:3-isopropylmalate/(R)-2-methylmalate dehydratase small subunit